MGRPGSRSTVGSSRKGGIGVTRILVDPDQLRQTATQLGMEADRLYAMAEQVRRAPLTISGESRQLDALLSDVDGLGRQIARQGEELAELARSLQAAADQFQRADEASLLLRPPEASPYQLVPGLPPLSLMATLPFAKPGAPVRQTLPPAPGWHPSPVADPKKALGLAGLFTGITEAFRWKGEGSYSAVHAEGEAGPVTWSADALKGSVSVDRDSIQAEVAAASVAARAEYRWDERTSVGVEAKLDLLVASAGMDLKEGDLSGEADACLAKGEIATTVELFDIVTRLGGRKGYGCVGSEITFTPMGVMLNPMEFDLEPIFDQTDERKP